MFKYYDHLDNIKDFLAHVGRNKFVSPVYQSFAAADIDLGVQIFKQNADFYHPLTQNAIKKILNLN